MLKYSGYCSFLVVNHSKTKSPLLAELKEELLQGGRVKQKLGFIKQVDKVRLPL